jgi:KRAB domain-containing zinc finger protein
VSLRHFYFCPFRPLFLCSLCRKLFQSAGAVLQHMAAEHKRQAGTLRVTTTLPGNPTNSMTLQVPFDQFKRMVAQKQTGAHAQNTPPNPICEIRQPDEHAESPLTKQAAVTKQSSAHAQTARPPQTVETNPASLTAHAPKQQMECSFADCDYSTLRPELLRRHINGMHLHDTCRECGKQVIRSRMSAHYLTHNKERPQLPCPKVGCDRMFITHQGLKGHVAMHSAPTIACTQCDRLLHTKALLRVHVAKQHGGERRHLCSECGAAFFTAGELTAHAQRHAPGRPFACDVAGCFFATKMPKGLINHKISVHQATPTQCPECGKMLKSINSFRGHMARFHSERRPPRVQLECNLCQRFFPSSWHLRDHLLQHENARRFECDLCKKRFNTLILLKMHLVATHFNRILKCSECGDKFRSKLALKNHQLRHTGERPYTCPYCAAMFRQNSTFDRHKRTQHKEQYALETNKRPRIKHL